MRTDEPGPSMGIIDGVLRWSIAHRTFVVTAAIVLTIYGVVVARRMPVDVFPDLTAPTVTVVTEAHSMAPEEVEALVTAPIEAALNGQTNVRRVRSISGLGTSIVWVEFDWDTDILRARQLVGEKLALAASQLPRDVGAPQLAPVASVMGEIMFVGLRSDRHRGYEVRDAAEWQIRRRLLAVPGVAQVVPIGGGLKQYQVLVRPERLVHLRVTLDEVHHALATSNQNTSGGLLIRGPQQHLIRGLGRLRSRDDIARLVVKSVGGKPVTIGQLADVEIGPGPMLGEGGVDGDAAVVMAIAKQPDTNTLTLTRALDRELDAIAATLPAGMRLDRHLFRQADFIDAAVDNVAEALRDGAILVVIILLLFLLELRATLISAVALPVSLVVAVIVLDRLGKSLDTMTLGGLTIAIGALVDDAIIDVENVVRRIRLEALRPVEQRRPLPQVVYEASREVRSSIVFATAIVMLVFVPVFFLTGVEGRLLEPLGFAYLVAIFASLVVSLTLTPALCVLTMRGAMAKHREPPVPRVLGAGYQRALRFTLAHGAVVVAVALTLVVGAGAVATQLGRSFLPEFNEGALTINLVTLPGTSLTESDAIGRRAEAALLTIPEVASTARRTGRAELDEHAQDVNASEMEVRLRPGRPRAEVLAEVRAALARLPGVSATIGQPISHRIDHMLSGTRAAIAVKLFGDDLYTLRVHAEELRRVIAAVPGAVDVAIEQQVDLPQIVVDFEAERAARAGAHRGELAEALERALVGAPVATVIEEVRAYPVVLRYRPDARTTEDDLARTPIDVPGHGLLPLGMLARIIEDVGPNTISRESGQRKMVVMANVAGRDLGSVVADIRARVTREVRLPSGYYVVYGGQFESQERATRALQLLGALVVAAIFVILQIAFGAGRHALLIMINLPLALIGGLVAAYLGDAILSVGSLIGFITLFGIATRNGIMLVSHFEHLRRVEGVGLDEAVVRGARERLSPILMTALSAGLALVPLVLAAGEPGNEIQAPMAQVIVGGLVSSTALNLFLVPLGYRWLEARALAAQR